MMTNVRILLLPLLIAVALTTAAACGDDDGDEPATDTPDPAQTSTPAATKIDLEPGVNALLNPGFENGEQSWASAGPNKFTVTSDQALSGSAAAQLTMRATTDSPVSATYTVFQEFTPSEFPEVLSFNYLVNNWAKGTEKQYIEVAVIVYGGTEAFPTCPGPEADECPNYQIRYILGGVSQNPITVENSKYVFVSRDEPSQDEWIPITRDMKADFQNTWGAVPDKPEKIRILAEVRYDDREATDGPMEADVYFDDMFVGTKG
jgi:hypothetical protein